MKKISFILMAISITFSACEQELSDIKESNPKLQNIRNVMLKAFNWQLKNPGKRTGDKSWQRSVFYTGIMAAYFTLQEDVFYAQALKWSTRNQWQVSNRARNADDQSCGQVYLEIYSLEKQAFMIKDVKDSIDNMINNPLEGRVDWWWCDALYMAPPVVAKLGTATGEEKYREYLHTMWWDVVDYLYDDDEHLFYRDERFIGELNEDGKKIFWSRGNGWVMGGLVRVMEQLLEDDPYFPQYVNLLNDMAYALVPLQGDDGLWRPSLLDPDEAPYPETSGTGFFCYALAWGVNNGLLDKDVFLPVIQKAWEGLLWAVSEQGRVGWTQETAAGPGEVKEENYEEYSTGAFLLAGSEVYKLYKKRLLN